MKKRILFSGLFLFLIVFHLSAVNKTWIASSSGKWKTPGNWSPSGVPGAGDIAIFSGSGLGACIIDTATVNIAGIQMNSGFTSTVTRRTSCTSFTIGTSNAVFSAGTFRDSSAVAMTINGTFTLSGGTFVSTSNTLTLASTVTNTSGTFTHNNGTVVLSSTGAVNIPLWNFNSLTSSSSGARTFFAGTTKIAGVFTTGTNSYTVSTGARIEFNGAAQNIPALPSSVAYRRLICGGTGNKTATGALIVNDSLIINASRTLAMSTFALSGSFLTGGTGNLTTACTIAPPSGVPIPESKTWSYTTVSYNSSSAQVIVPGNYLSLNGTGGARTLRNTGDIQIGGTFTPGTGSYTVTGSTVNYKSASAQTIAAFNYENLTITNARGANNVTLANSGIIGISGVFTNTATFTTGSFVTTGSTVNYNGNNSQQIIPFNYFNLIVRGNRSTNSVTFSSAGTIKIAKIFAPHATFTTGNYITTGTTIEFNGTLDQTIPSFQYHNLVSSSTGARSFSTEGTVKITGVFTKGTNNYTNFGKSGDSYKPLNSNVFTAFSSIHSIDADTAYVVGTGGLILKTTDGGSTWVQKTSGVTNDLRAVKFYNSQNGVIVGTTGKILRTTNWGNTWTQPSSGSSQILSGICYKTQDSIFVTAANGTLLISSNGGDNWVGTSAISAQALYQMVFTTPSIGFVVGNAGTILKTSNGGSSWSSVSHPAGTSYLFTSIIFTNSNTGYIVGGNTSTFASIVLKSTDGGNTWVSNYTSSNRYFTGLSFKDANNGFISCGNVANNTGAIMRTSDAGASWVSVETGTSRLGGVSLFGTSAGYFCGLDGAIVKYNCCTDGGTLEFNGTSGQYINGGSTTVLVNKLKINKNSGKLYLNAPVLVDKKLTFTKGVIVSSASNTLQFSDNVDTVAGASDSTYVYGPVKKIGNDSFKFPLGDTTLASGAFHPLIISAPSATTDAYTARYYAQNQTYGSSLQTDSLESISNCEYFTLNRDVGVSIVIPSISWNTNNCNVFNYDHLRIGYWNGSSWKLLGNKIEQFDDYRGIIEANYGFNLSSLPLVLANSSVEVLNNTIPLTDAGSDVSICFGEEVRLNASGAEKYLWYPSYGISDVSINNPIVSPDSTTKYFLIGTNGNNSVLDSILVTVKPKPILTKTNSIYKICQGGSASINCSGSGTFLWSPSVGLNDSTISSPVAAPTLSTTYSVSLMGSNGCVTEDLVDVVVNNVFGFVPDTLLAEREKSVYLTSISNGEFFDWSPGSSLQDSTANITSASPVSSSDYSLTVTNDGCNSTTLSSNIQVLDRPTASFTYSFPGLTVQFLTNNTQQAVYLWDFGDGATSSNASPSHTYSIVGDYLVCLKITNLIGEEIKCENINVR